MAATTRFGLRYPVDGDDPNVPRDIEHLAEDVEARLGYAGAQAKKLYIPADQSTSSASYVELGTPDRVDGIVIENAGDLLVVHYSALVKASAVAHAAVFLNTAQLKAYSDAGAPAVQEANISSGNDWDWVRSSDIGLGATTVAGDASEVSTGLVAAGLLVIERLAAGTYNVGVRYKTTSGAVHAKSRRLAAWTEEFPA